MSIKKRIERIEAILDARGLDWDHPRVEADHFADANKMVAEEPAKKWRRLTDEFVQPGDWANAKVNRQDVDPPEGGWISAEPFYFGKRACTLSMYFARPVAGEPAKEPEHPAGPMPDPGEGYRILSKNPPEELAEGDEFLHPGLGRWAQSVKSMCGGKKQDVDCWYRRKIGFPAKEPEPAWEPKVGDRVLVTRPENWKEWKDPLWREEMHIYDGRVFELVKWSQSSTGRRASLQGIDWFFHRDWLSPAEPPAIDKPLETEYREPVLPGDAGKECEVSDNGLDWRKARLAGYKKASNPWSYSTIVGEYVCRHARIKKDA